MPVPLEGMKNWHRSLVPWPRWTVVTARRVLSFFD